MPHIKERTADAAESPFLPTGTGNKCYLPCLPGSKTVNFAGSITSKPSGGEDESGKTALMYAEKNNAAEAAEAIAKAIANRNAR